LACQITLQPIDRYAGLLDASIIFSDILVVPKAMGMSLQMSPGKGPTFDHPLDTPHDIEGLNTKVDVRKELGYVLDAIALTRKELNGRVPLFGFVGAPWTLMGYMIEGAGSKTYTRSKSFLYKYPEESKGLLQRITDICIEFLAEQIMAGAQVSLPNFEMVSDRKLVQVFDSWAGELSPIDFATFSLPYILQIPSRTHAILESRGYYTVNPRVPMVIFAKGAWHALELLGESDYDIISLDWTHDPVQARKRVGPNKILQGNMDPNGLYGGQSHITQEVERIVKGFGGGKGGYIVNLGHGITPVPGTPTCIS